MLYRYLVMPVRVLGGLSRGEMAGLHRFATVLIIGRVVCRANVTHLTCRMKYAPDESKPFNIQISRFNEDGGKEPGSDGK